MPAVLLALQAIVITTHFCALSWIYDIGVKMMGSWEGPIELEKAQELLNNGAKLVDVREPNEFARGHLDGAENFPLSVLDKEMNELQGKVCLLYCASGMRSQIATKQLKKCGCTEVYNLGAIGRGNKLKT